MPYMLSTIEVDDYELFKKMFDADPTNARERAMSHRLLRGEDNPNEVFVQVEFPTAEDAQEARERLRAAGVFDRVKLNSGPTIVNEAEVVAYA